MTHFLYAKKKFSICFLILAFLQTGQLYTQEGAQMEINFEFQAYPTGLIPGVNLEKHIGVRNTIHLRLGYNWIRHRDLGEHEDERGDGIGFSLGMKRFFSAGFQGWHLGIRNDLWYNTLDWRDQIGETNEESGMTKITVVQPTASLGYLFSKNNLIFSPHISFGFEINVKTEGESVGEGPILLLGFSFGKRF